VLGEVLSALKTSYLIECERLPARDVIAAACAAVSAGLRSKTAILSRRTAFSHDRAAMCGDGFQVSDEFLRTKPEEDSMRGTRWWAVAVAVVMAGVMATDAFAQRRDRGYRGEWQLLGEKRVGFRVDRDVVRINQPEEWYRTRAFRSIHLVAEGSDIHLINVRLVYLNGYGEDFRVDRLIQDGDDMPIELRGDRSYLRDIEFTYRARPSFGGQAVLRVFGEPSRRMDGPPPSMVGPPPVIGDRDRDRGRDRDWDRRSDWAELGCKQVSLFGRDRDSIDVGRREGRFQAIRLYVRGADVEMLDLRVVYASGERDDIRVRNVIRQGDRTRPLELGGNRGRRLDRVEMVYRTVPNFKGLATVCVEGLQ
jgi:hypothetical protein